jgi:protein N-terminal amidase
MAFTGYTFRDAARIAPLAERCGEGATHAWCAALAARLGAFVACGYPELGGDAVAAASGEAPAAPLFNSQMLVAPSGAVLANHRKHHLYVTDETWAQPGGGWTSCRLRTLRVRVSLGVCMDINPWQFKAPWDAYELATAALEARSGLLLFSSAWCDRSPDDPPDYKPPPVDAHSTLSYWAARLVPLLEAPARTHFVCADRVGRECDTNFCGCSCVMSLGSGASATLLGALGVREEGLLLRDVDALSDDDDDDE